MTGEGSKATGTTRRQFLGAAAAAASLTVTGTAAGTEDSTDTSTEQRDEDPEYGTTTVMTSGGGLELWAEPQSGIEVDVSSHPEGTTLKLRNGTGAMRVLLLPEDIDVLCEELQAAAAKTKPQSVEYARGWITEDIRDGDGNV